ncbi:Rho GTPase activation protein [Pseudohyphozyma bogoriensis]|nr:Rho GTPase activation protein [Pseudohyphozyma bogoriensis]
MTISQVNGTYYFDPTLVQYKGTWTQKVPPGLADTTTEYYWSNEANATLQYTYTGGMVTMQSGWFLGLKGSGGSDYGCAAGDSSSEDDLVWHSANATTATSKNATLCYWGPLSTPSIDKYTDTSGKNIFYITNSPAGGDLYVLGSKTATWLSTDNGLLRAIHCPGTPVDVEFDEDGTKAVE